MPRLLSTGGAPAAHDPAAADIGYWAPGGDLVLYYDAAAPRFEGIVRIGMVRGELEVIRRLPKALRVNIALVRRLIVDLVPFR